MWRWRLILNDWPFAGAHPLNTTRGCRGRDLVALARTAGESTPRTGSSPVDLQPRGRAQDTLIVQLRRCCSRPGVGIGVHGVVAPHEVAMPKSLCRFKPPFSHGQPQDRSAEK